MFNAVVYVSGYIFLLFVAICLGRVLKSAPPSALRTHHFLFFATSMRVAACGLYYLAELVEEHTTLTKRLMSSQPVAVLIAHRLFYLFEQLPLMAILSGAAAHGCYLWLLQTFPFLNPTSPQFLASLAACVISHFFWISHFLSHYHSMTHVLSFFLFTVWLVPFGFFISLSVNESTLPQGGGGLGGSSGSAFKLSD